VKVAPYLLEALVATLLDMIIVSFKLDKSEVIQFNLPCGSSWPQFRIPCVAFSCFSLQ